MKICIVGSGPSGLTTIKQLKDEGHSVTCFEKSDGIGGIWYRKDDASQDAEKMRVFDNLILTISIKLMCFSDYMWEGDRVFFNHKQYYNYLREYADQFKLEDHVLLNSEVKNIQKTSDGHWLVSVLVNEKMEQHTFDAVAICCGPFQSPNLKSAIDLDKYTGEIVHSSTYRNNKKFEGKRVLLVGLAESGADIVREISDVSAEATLSITSYSFLLPRIIAGKYSTDSLTYRCHHYEMYVRAQKTPYKMKSLFGSNWLHRSLFMSFAYIYGLTDNILNLFRKKVTDNTPPPEKNILGEAMDPAKLDISCELTPENIYAINEWNRRSHSGMSNWTQHVIFSKNVSFIPNILNEKLAVNDSGIEKISGNRVFFKNGETKDVDAIVLCTGFINDFSLLGSDLSVKDNNVRNLYKHAFHPDHGGRLAYIGFVRPMSGGIPITSEMQARYFAQLCSNKLKLPADVDKKIQEDKAWEDEMVRLSPRRPETIPSQIFLIDSIAKEMGCLMPLSKLILHPKLFIRHWFYPFHQACYRLTGPHSNYDKALKQIMDDKPGASVLFFSKLTYLKYLLSPHTVHPKYLEIPGGTDGSELPKSHFMYRRTWNK